MAEASHCTSTTSTIIVLPLPLLGHHIAHLPLAKHLSYHYHGWGTTLHIYHYQNIYSITTMIGAPHCTSTTSTTSILPVPWLHGASHCTSTTSTTLVLPLLWLCHHIAHLQLAQYLFYYTCTTMAWAPHCTSTTSTIIVLPLLWLWHHIAHLPLAQHLFYHCHGWGITLHIYQ